MGWQHSKAYCFITGFFLCKDNKQVANNRMENIFKVCFITHLSLTLAERGLNIPQSV